MATYTDILTRAKLLMIDVPDAFSTEFPNLIRMAQQQAEDAHGWKELEATATLVTSPTVPANRVLGPKPSDWNGERDLPWWQDGQGRVTEFEWIHGESQITRNYSSDPDETGAPAHLHVTADGNLNVYPYPNALCPTGSLDSSGNYTVMVPYWKRLPVLALSGAGTTTENWFSDNLSDYLTWFCVGWGRKLNENVTADANDWLGMAKAELERQIKQDMEHRRPRTHVVGYRTGAGASIFKERNRNPYWGGYLPR